MNLFQTKGKDGHWAVSFRSADGQMRVAYTTQSDKYRATKVIRLARIENMEFKEDSRKGKGQASSFSAYEQWLAWMNDIGTAPTTIERYEKVVQMFLVHLHWPLLPQITTQDVDQWINSTEVKLHVQTRNVNLAAIVHFLKYCANNGWCHNVAGNAVVKMHLLSHEQKESKVRRPFTQAEFEALIAVARKKPMPYWYGALMIARYTGLRWGDVANLEWASVLNDRIVVWTDKRDRRVELPMPAELAPVFAMLKVHPLNQPALPADPAQPQMVFPKRRKDEEFTRLREAAGLPKCLCLHSLRHTYATELARSGVSINEIALRMGHFSPSTTLRYLSSTGLLPITLQPYFYNRR